MASTTGDQWVKAPGNPAADQWITWQTAKTTLVVAPHISALDRYRDVLPVLSGDRRIQVMFTIPDSTDRWLGPEELLGEMGVLVLPWHQVIRTQFDLALAASFQGIHQLQAPVVVMPHGAGTVKSRYSPWATKDDAILPHGLDRELMVRDGRVVPAAVVVTHQSELAILEDAGPDILSRAALVGDPCLDRLRTSVALRGCYRRSLGITDDQKLVVVSTTWSPCSLIGTDVAFFNRLAKELPRDEYRIIAIVHPIVWCAHGAWQLRSWLADAVERGMGLVPMGGDWRGVLVAADYVLGDHGSVTQYGAALGIPVLMNLASDRDIRPRSIAACVRLKSTPLDVNEPIDPQLRRVGNEHRPEWAEQVAERITSWPDRAAINLRRVLYQLLKLSEPTDDVRVPLVPVPNAIR